MLQLPLQKIIITYTNYYLLLIIAQNDFLRIVAAFALQSFPLLQNFPLLKHTEGFVVGFS